MRHLYLFLLLCPYVTFAQSPVWTWAKLLGGDDLHEVKGVASDKKNCVFITGRFQDTIYFTPSNYLVTSATADEGFLARYDSSGNFRWAMKFGGSSQDLGRAVAADTFGNVYLAGHYRSTSMTFGTYTLTGTGNDKTFIAKVDSSGNIQWVTKVTEGTSNGYPTGIEVNNRGHLFLSGTWGFLNLTIGTTTYTYTNSDEIFYASYNTSNGTLRWSGVAQGGFNDYSDDVALDESGNCYLTGWYSFDTLEFTGNMSILNYGGYDSFVASFDSLGNSSWIKQVKGSQDQFINGIDAALNGTIYLSGYMASGGFNCTLIDTNFTNSSVIHFVAQITQAGTRNWHRTFILSSLGRVYAIETDNASNGYISGFCNSGNFGGYTVSPPTQAHFIAKISPSSIFQWAVWGAGYATQLQGDMLDVDAGGNCYMGSFFGSSANQLASFGNINLYCMGQSDGYLARLDVNFLITGEEEFPVYEGIWLTPNPADDLLFIKAPEELLPGKLSIYDLAGRLAASVSVEDVLSGISIEHLRPGCYFAHFTGREGEVLSAGKIIKK